MAKENFVFLNLGEDQATEISQTIANKKARLILDELKRGHATESELSSKLAIPLSTVHYNVQQLVKAGLVVGDQFHYSPKGREVSHYRLTNKVIVIAPQGTPMDQLVKSLVPAALILAAGTAFVGYIAQQFSAPTFAPFMAKSAAIAPTPGPQVMSTIANADIARETAPAAGAAVNEAANQAVAVATSEPHYALWFLIGGIVILGVSLLGMWLWNKARN